MTTSIKVLTTATVDSSPALLLCDPNGNKTLVNCGEGCQRSFLEANALRVKSVRRICLTHLDHTSVGGLPGLILTSADAAAAAAAEKQAKVNNGSDNHSTEATDAESHSSKTPLSSNNHDTAASSPLPDLEIVGPEKTQTFIRSLRHFMRRDQYKLKIIEGAYREEEPPRQAGGGGKKKQKKRKRETQQPPSDGGGFSVESIPFQYTVTATTGERQQTATHILSFLFQTAAIKGKFLIEKAKELGIPKGHLYGQLKSGRAVTFKNEAGVDVTVESHQVVAPESPGSAVLVVFCPTRPILDQLKTSGLSSRFQGTKQETAQVKGKVQLDIMVHMTPRDLFESEEYRRWMSGCFPASVEHMWFNVNEGSKTSIQAASTPFSAAAKGAFKRNLLCPTLYKKISRISMDESSGIVMTSDGDNLRIRCAQRMLEYLLIPRLRKGYVSRETAGAASDWDELTEEECLVECKESGAIELASKMTGSVTSADDAEAELCFTGTGSALPCKHRNVSGIMLRTSREGDCMLMDVGEGTIGQLYRMQPKFDVAKVHAVWISHPHADHHLGLVRLLSERQELEEGMSKPLLLMAPPNLFRFLEEYAQVDANIRHSYLQVDCTSMVAPRTLSASIRAELQERLGVTNCAAVPVAHCPHAYAVIVDGTKFGRVAYSGDCRPSDRFAQEAQGADVLIHEATFEDGMEVEATLKKHSTVGEALTVRRKMNAKSIILTHFSQRYPKIPRLPVCGGSNMEENGSTDVPVAVAFDFMCVTPASLHTATLLTPALRLLYPDDQEETSGTSASQNSTDLIDAKAVLEVPGVFAQPGII